MRNFKWASAAGKMSAFIEKVARFGQIRVINSGQIDYFHKMRHFMQTLGWKVGENPKTW